MGDALRTKKVDMAVELFDRSIHAGCRAGEPSRDEVQRQESAVSPDIIATTQLGPAINIHQHEIKGAIACLIIHDTVRYRRDQNEKYIS